MGFSLHPRLAADCVVVGNLNLCQVLLMNDSRWPWLILVPRREGVGEIFQLSPEDQLELIEESSLVGQVLLESFRGDKLNIAALGNLVPQLHLHHVLRHAGDPAWPGPVWGVGEATPYEDEWLGELLAGLRADLPGLK